MSIEIITSELVETLPGMLLKRETWRHAGEMTSIKAAYSTKDNSYIGDWRDARSLNTRGIEPEKAHEWNTVASIGFCAAEQKWYGWSHRAMFGFGVGSKVKQGDCTNEDLPVGFEAKTLDDAKKMAIAFADCVA